MPSKYKFEQWLFVIARTHVLDFFRAKSRYEKRLQKIENLEEMNS
jgi:DNA-directed RNA polymerase specialized sigma24 family protein